MRLIDADLPMEQMGKLLDHHLMMGNFSADSAVIDCIEFLKTAPTIDAVPVVRCKDCKHARKLRGVWKCSDNYFNPRVVKGNGFCSSGKRKDEESE